jgi:hypothetical protein
VIHVTRVGFLLRADVGTQASRQHCLASGPSTLEATLHNSYAPSRGLAQNEVVQRMRLTDDLLRGETSDFKLGRRVPPLQVLLEYMRASGMYMDALVDDGLICRRESRARLRPKGFKRIRWRRRKPGSVW